MVNLQGERKREKLTCVGRERGIEEGSGVKEETFCKLRVDVKGCGSWTSHTCTEIHTQTHTAKRGFLFCWLAGGLGIFSTQSTRSYLTCHTLQGGKESPQTHTFRIYVNIQHCTLTPPASTHTHIGVFHM